MSDPIITFFQNSPPQTPFAPTWQYAIYEGTLTKINFKTLAKFILKKEKEILSGKNIPLSNDGYTGLGKNSLTAHYRRYNVLTWKHPEIPKIQQAILKAHEDYLKELQIPLGPELYIQCWTNVMRKGEQIKPHLHGVHADSYLGGHIVVQAQETQTYFMNPVNQLNEPETHPTPNTLGKICLFPSYLPHYTDIQLSITPRITIAFDLVMNHSGKTTNYKKLI